VKVTQARGAKAGGIITPGAPIHISNVMVIDPKTSHPPASDTARRRWRSVVPTVPTYAKQSAVRGFPVARVRTSTTTLTEIPRLKARYREEIVPALREEFALANVMQVPGVTKVVVNMGVGDAARDSKLIEGAIRASPPSPGRSRRSPRPASPSLSSSCAKACPSVPT
jgi:hypothetical protein